MLSFSLFNLPQDGLVCLLQKSVLVLFHHYVLHSMGAKKYGTSYYEHQPLALFSRSSD